MTLLITKEISERTVKFVGSQSHAGHGRYCEDQKCWLYILYYAGARSVWATACMLRLVSLVAEYW